MSMQRVLETARKLGLPVVVTDPAGREPFVILPMEQFEAMAWESKVEKSESPKLKVAGSDFFPLNEAQNPIESLPIEDRFYLEPMGEEQGE